MKNDDITDIYTYMRQFATDLGERILERYPALHQFTDPVSARLTTLLRTPFPAQSVTIMGIMKRWQIAPTALVVAECGAGKDPDLPWSDARVERGAAIYGDR